MRCITDQRTLVRWTKSKSYAALVTLITELSDSVVGRRVSDELSISPAVQLVLDALEEMSGWIAEIPPLKQAMRYGNKAFKEWHARMVERAPVLMLSLLEGENRDEAQELAGYWSDAFGNAARIDYGTGHELALLTWVGGLRTLGALTAEDNRAVVLRLFERYLRLMRQLQTTYWLEPAGSHGVWGLDDFQFLPFLFGAAQLANHPEIRPSSTHDEEVLRSGASDYLYLAAVAFVRQVKKGPFHEHSPYLNDISHLSSWQQVAAGLLRMYKGEVLGKLPVVQHLKFGTLLPWDSQFAD